ncbi:MAG: exo-alpha-sialidase [Oscillospiraceae bacterium]|nr:exo-alpha-sialidase [Oscillospiraceae bacterium]
MKAHKNWSYAPYRPPFTEVGEPYICRVAPAADAIALQWLPCGAAEYTVFCRVRGEGEFLPVLTTGGDSAVIGQLCEGKEYEFYVQAEEKRSRIRLALCAAPFDTVVNYLHPEDEAYAFSGRYLCSPSLVRLPDGALLASMDLFAGNCPQNLSLIFRSEDDGRSWRYISELFPCFWGKLFVHGGALYMLAVNTEYGDLLIGRSDDGGYTFGEPTVLLRGGGGKNGEAGVHKNPQPVVEYAGRLWNTLEWGAWGRGYHAPMVMSAAADADLLDADSWLFSEPVKYDPGWPGLPAGPSSGNIEGALTVINGALYNVMRYDMTRTTPNYGKVIAYKVNTDEPEAPLTYDRCIDFPANHSKFSIKYDPLTQKYYSIASRITGPECIGHRNLLSLMVSADGLHWQVLRDLADRRGEDPAKVGFQYVDFLIENGEILYLCRTAINNAHNFHDANYSTFGRVSLTNTSGN